MPKTPEYNAKRRERYASDAIYREREKSSANRWRELHKQEINEARRKKYREDEEHRQRMLRDAHKYYVARRPHNLGGNGGVPTSARKYREMVVNLLLQRDGNLCALCTKVMTPTEATIDHILSQKKGGTHTAENLQLAHLTCNMKRRRI